MGLHDDSLFSYLVGRYTLAYGTNLSRFQMPIDGKEPSERKHNIARMSYNLQEANRLSTRASASKAFSYNGLANDAIEESAYFELRKKIDEGGRIGAYTTLTKIEELNKAERHGRFGSDIWDR